MGINLDDSGAAVNTSFLVMFFMVAGCYCKK
jgi:hypothetical protein